MRWRTFILVGGAAAWLVSAHAQQSAMPVVGFLNAESPDAYGRMLAAFREGLKKTGFVEGQNVAIKYRWAEGRNEQLPGMAVELVQHHVAVIAATSTPGALAAKAATTTIPIVFEIGTDPIEVGLVASLKQPGGNITGVTQLSEDVTAKQLQLLHEVLPTAHVIALLVNPADPVVTKAHSREALSAARSLGLELHILNASTVSDFDGVFADAARLHGSGLLIASDALFTSHAEQLAALSAKHPVPAVYKGREFVAAGGLMSYGSDVVDAYYLTGMFTGQILKGKKPADLPVQQATKVELVINLKTAKTLGLSFPLSLLGRADEVIE
jgi:putative tryptophan/tyrosine transport system substrate-binding protein